MSMTLEQAQTALQKVVDPNTSKDLMTSRSARNVRVDGGDVSVDVELGYPAASQIEPIRRSVIDALKAAGAANAGDAESSEGAGGDCSGSGDTGTAPTACSGVASARCTACSTNW